MGAASSKSKKASDANSGSPLPPESRVFFIDKCLGRNIVASALRACGESIELMESHFDPDTPDTEWVPQVGARGWIILSKDSRMRTNARELVALLKANTHSFILTAQNHRGPDMAAAFVAALHDMKQIIAKEPAPLIANVSTLGNVRIFMTRSDLIKKVGENAERDKRIANYGAKTSKKHR